MTFFDSKYNYKSQFLKIIDYLKTQCKDRENQFPIRNLEGLVQKKIQQRYDIHERKVGCMIDSYTILLLKIHQMVD